MFSPGFLEYINALAARGWGADDATPEESLRKEPFFDQEAEGAEEHHVEVGADSYSPLPVGDGEPVQFSAFLDGVQRTVAFMWVSTPGGATVPLHVAQIAAAVMVRGRNGRLRFDPEMFSSRTLVLMPWEGLKDAGVDLPKPSDAPEDCNELTFSLEPKAQFFFCDTTYPGITTREDNRARNERPLAGERLYNISEVRARAQTRVAVMRQILELLVLACFRARFPEGWVLVDGPLFLLEKWQQGGLKEERILRNAVGYIKSCRKRPPTPREFKVVLGLGDRERTPVKRLEREPMPKGGSEALDEAGRYRRCHLDWYIRMRVPVGWCPPGPQGLVRLDVEVSTLGLDRGDSPTLRPEGFGPHVETIDRITRGIWREMWPAPGPPRDPRGCVEVYPVAELERTLHNRLYPLRALAYISRLPR